jgi:hypothetical protein
MKNTFFDCKAWICLGVLASCVLPLVTGCITYDEGYGYHGDGYGGYGYYGDTGYSRSEYRNHPAYGRPPPPHRDDRYDPQYRPERRDDGGRRGGKGFVATLTARGKAKEVAVNCTISHIVIEANSGNVIINTVVIREGSEKDARPQAVRLSAGERHVIVLGGRRHVTGLRISDSGGGNYSVYVR